MSELLEASGWTAESRNVLGGRLDLCSREPLTGFYRDGCCNTGSEDAGVHVICAEMSAPFLEYSLNQGNDLSTAQPLHDFPGLRPGDRWCLCAARWLQAHEEGKAPRVFLAATHERVLEVVSLDVLMEYAIDLA